MDWWVIVALVAIVGAFFTEYQKNKMDMKNRSHHNEEEVDDVRKLVNSLKIRIENLEAIAAGEPDEFKTGAGKGMKEIEIEEMNTREANRKEVSKLSNNLRTE